MAKPIGLLIAFMVVLYFCFRLIGYDPQAAVQTDAVISTGLIVAWYTYETRLLRSLGEEQLKTVRQSNEFAAVTAIHNRLSEKRGFDLREYLYGSFRAELVQTVNETFGPEYIDARNWVNLADPLE